MVHEVEVVSHYSRSSLIDDLSAALVDAGHDLEALPPSALFGFEEFHLGGRPATVAVVESLHLAADTRVLDVGCGIGGAARMMANAGGCAVTGIDLTEDFVETARWLSSLVGMESQTSFDIAGALDLPFDDESFDVATMLHVGMNIVDKTALLLELARVLAPGGTLVVFDVMRMDDGELSYPMPWASGPATSFVSKPSEYADLMAAAGLTVESIEDRRQLVADALAAVSAKPPAVNLGHLVGPDWPNRFANLATAFRAGIVSPVQILARKSA